MSNTLLPCPFCGGEALLRERYINGTANIKHYRRECCHCKATFANWYRSIKNADEAWNRRAQPENSRAHARETGICPMCEDCPDGCPVETPKDSRNKMTNAQRIRGMSDEGLAAIIAADFPEEKLNYCQNKPECSAILETADGIISDEWCIQCALDWLKAETEGTE